MDAASVRRREIKAMLPVHAEGSEDRMLPASFAACHGQDGEAAGGDLTGLR
jgi:hypothetical protein